MVAAVGMHVSGIAAEQHPIITQPVSTRRVVLRTKGGSSAPMMMTSYDIRQVRWSLVHRDDRTVDGETDGAECLAAWAGKQLRVHRM